VGAVVSRGGRPDLAGEALRRVTAPTLLIVGGNDIEVLRLNELALAALAGEARLEVVPGAGHLFEEPGALERVAVLRPRLVPAPPHGADRRAAAALTLGS
jgi:pimeloyl-ACP methyl ester carboxylesterase